jgi:hypothetical protein
LAFQPITAGLKMKGVTGLKAPAHRNQSLDLIITNISPFKLLYNYSCLKLIILYSNPCALARSKSNK